MSEQPMDQSESRDPQLAAISGSKVCTMATPSARISA